MLASPVNPADINTIQGTYAIKPKQLPAVPGNEGVGVVVHSDPASTGLKLGDWVIPATPAMGTWQAYLLGAKSDFIKIPSNIPLASAATISVNPCTAYRLLNDFESLKPGDCVIQNGGNSAVGQAVIQLCREFGLKCVSLVRPRDDFKALKARLIGLGNSDTTVITDDELRSSMKGLRAQLGLNCVGGKSATEILRVLEPSRTMVTYGGMSRQPVIIPTSHLIFNDIKIKGFWMTRWNGENSIESRSKMLNEIASLMSTTKFLPPEHKFVPLAKYREALENTMKGYTGVKYILSFDKTQ
ncbi:Trans-2-enoyl-CoA reductase, mitochondrial [Orchesella cincta]|uniref:Enoyl-[acyl-carrier-protein] reductase, mitochondrial n=1 Tax=Orchesella cincta TaxID=48709 RepID=A0A1D2MLW9_ORCCI|nr:Trans-2-enoyl-CoA reductase, mitochondrial [Orchesella cincta]